MNSLFDGFRGDRSLRDEGLDLVEPALDLVCESVLFLGSNQGWKERDQGGDTHFDSKCGRDDMLGYEDRSGLQVRDGLIGKYRKFDEES